VNGIAALSAFDEKTKDLNVVIESPRGCRNKYTFDPARDLFYLSGILAAGHSFPFDFGFIPGTLGGDGDPLDVLLVMDEPAFTGCLVPSRLIGVIEAEQTEKGETERNDRLIAVPANSHTQTGIRTLSDLDKTLIEQMEHFFVSYNEAKGKKFRILGRFGVQKALRAVKSAAAKDGKKG
jgi:inorganic pyrophosphatase